MTTIRGKTVDQHGEAYAQAVEQNIADGQYEAYELIIPSWEIESDNDTESEAGNVTESDAGNEMEESINDSPQKTSTATFQQGVEPEGSAGPAPAAARPGANRQSRAPRRLSWLMTASAVVLGVAIARAR